jgi:hypothetical protein
MGGNRLSYRTYRIKHNTKGNVMPYIHWNYFLALESDLAQVSRYIEFDRNNFKTYSIELAHLLLAASSEVDVIAKGICAMLGSTKKASKMNIDHYRNIICARLPEFVQEPVSVPRFNLEFHPWAMWQDDQNPAWWDSYNDVKHRRGEHFEQANLEHTLYSMGGLFVAVFYFYKLKFMLEDENNRSNKAVFRILGVEPGFMQLRDEYYTGHLLFG